jgi:hypothetical protein
MDSEEQALTLPLGFAERAPPSPLQGEGDYRFGSQRS